mmetsp:Transcript_83135/g.262658  ORF Transcript_83135/g.262658 Transcript_83135/m.262658 type:complete len:209 (+) Transcript_83135:250-876(+)
MPLVFLLSFALEKPFLERKLLSSACFSASWARRCASSSRRRRSSSASRALSSASQALRSSSRRCLLSSSSARCRSRSSSRARSSSSRRCRSSSSFFRRCRSCRRRSSTSCCILTSSSRRLCPSSVSCLSRLRSSGVLAIRQKSLSPVRGTVFSLSTISAPCSNDARDTLTVSVCLSILSRQLLQYARLNSSMASRSPGRGRAEGEPEP